MSLVLGIDLGTTNSCAAIFRNGKVDVIKTKEEDSVTPSFVFYDSNQIIIGKEAVNLSSKNPRNGIFDSKRFIGRCYDDEHICKAPIFFPFKISKNHANEAVIDLKYPDGTKRTIRPEEVSALILVKILDDSLRYLQVKEKIRNVVITVPAYFTTRQRQATDTAARIAGLNVLKLLNEPTAAALAFFEDDSNFDSKTVLVYDLGGGTFDVSVIKFEQGKGNVIAVGGDAFLGGRDFDDNLVKHCMESIKYKFRFSVANQSIEDQRRSGRRLRQACEEAKKQLSSEHSVTIELDYFYGFDVEIDIERQEFEDINARLFKRTINILEHTLVDAKISKTDIDDIILVGGSTRIPKIEELVKDFFNRKPLNKKINREEGVAIGAALQAALLSNHPSQRIKRFIKGLTDVTPLSLGIKIFSKTEDQENCSVIIRRNTQIPVTKLKTYNTHRDYQTQIDLPIFEGENKIFKNNFHLGVLSIKGLTPKKAGKVTIVVKFEVDLNGILNVSATESLKKTTKTLEIKLNSGQLSDEEINKIYRQNILNYKVQEADKEEVLLDQ